MSSRTAGALVVVLLFAPSSWAQTYSLSFSKRADRMTWRPSFPSWNFTTPVTLSAAGDSTAQLRLSASASLNSTLDKRNGRNIWSESASIRSSVLYPILGPKASVGINANMSSNSVGAGRQKTRSQTFSFRFEYRPLTGGGGLFENLRFDVIPGLITARRASPVNPDSLIEETGLQYTGSMNTSPSFDVAGRKLNTNLSVRKTDNTLENSKSRTESVRMSGTYTLPGEARASLSLSESRSQTGVTRSVIDTADTAVVAELSERRSTSASSSISFKVLGFDVKSNQSWSEGLNTNTANGDEDPRNRFFARDRETESWNLRGDVRGRLTESLVASVRGAWKATDDRRLPVSLGSPTQCRFEWVDGQCRDPTDDREDRDLEIGGSLDWQLDEGHQLQVSGSTRMNRVDNPGAPEQDRDSYSQVGSLTYRGTRSSGLRYNVTLSSSFTHRINLHVSRSANNTRNRDLRLSTSTSYERLATTVSHSFEISARRTIFDFDREVNRKAIDRRSNIRRGWSMRHRLQRSLFKTLQVNTTYAYKADDLGTYLVEDGSQIVEEDNADHSIQGGMSYRPNNAVSLGASYNYRLDRQWDLSYTRDGAERDLARRNAHRNLSLTFDYKPTGYTGIGVRYSRAIQRSGTFDSLTANLSRSF